MQTEARVGVVVEGGQRGINSSHGAMDESVRKLAQQKPSHIGTISQLLAGGVAGALSKTCTAPLARLTILLQLQGMYSDVATMRNTSILHEASRIVREEGFRAFWKGNLVTIAHRLPYSSVNFYAYEHYKKLLRMVPGLENHRCNLSTDLGIHFVSGGLAGITAATTTYPLDLVRTRLAAQTNVIYYRGIWHALQTISREEGIFGLYRGLGATLLGVGPNIAISFSVYETLRTFWPSNGPNDSTLLPSLACGSLSGIASSTVDLIVGWHYLEEPISFPQLSNVRGILFEYVVPVSMQTEDHYNEPLVSLVTCQQATFPLDLVRRRKQVEGAGGRAHVYTTGTLGMFRHIMRTEGMRGLYRGILPEYYKVVPGVAICFTTYERLKMLLADFAATP